MFSNHFCLYQYILKARIVLTKKQVKVQKHSVICFIYSDCWGRGSNPGKGHFISRNHQIQSLEKKCLYCKYCHWLYIPTSCCVLLVKYMLCIPISSWVLLVLYTYILSQYLDLQKSCIYTRELKEGLENYIKFVQNKQQIISSKFVKVGHRLVKKSQH